MSPLLSNTDDDSDIKNWPSTSSRAGPRSGFTGRFRSTSTTDRRRSSIDIDATVTMRRQDRVEELAPSSPRDRPNPDACLVPVREGSSSTTPQRYFGDLSSSGSREGSTSTGEGSRSCSYGKSERSGPVEWQRGSGCEDRACLDGEDEEDVEDAEDAAYTRRRRLMKAGKRPIANVQAVAASAESSDTNIPARKSRRRRRDADNGLIPINQREVDSSLPSGSATQSIDNPPPHPSYPTAYSKSPPSSTIHAHPSSSHSFSTASSLSKTAEHDDTLTSITGASSSLSSRPTSSSTATSVGAIHHVSSPIPIVAGTLAGLIALLAAVVVTIIVIVKGRRSRARMRSRQGWLAQQQEMSGSAPGRDGAGGGDDSSRLGIGNGLNASADASRVRSRSAGGVRSGSGRRSGSTRGRESATVKTRDDRRRARSTSSSHESLSESEGPVGAFGGAINFGARGSVARMFDVPGARTAKSSIKRSHKKLRSTDETTDITSLQGAAELEYGPRRHNLHDADRAQSPSIELHTRPHKSSHGTPDSRHAFGAAHHYPPPTSTYGSISSTSSSYFSPSEPTGHDRRSPRPSRTKHGNDHTHTQPTHTSSPLAIFTHPAHLVDHSRSSTSSSSSPPPPHSPPPTLHGHEGGTIPLADVKHPNGPPDPVQSVQNYDFQDLPPAYDTSS